MTFDGKRVMLTKEVKEIKIHINGILQQMRNPEKVHVSVQPTKHRLYVIDQGVQEFVDGIMFECTRRKQKTQRSTSPLSTEQTSPKKVDPPYFKKLQYQRAIINDEEDQSEDIRRELVKRPELQSSREMLKYHNHLVSHAQKVFYNVQRLRNHNKWNDALNK